MRADYIAGLIKACEERGVDPKTLDPSRRSPEEIEALLNPPYRNKGRTTFNYTGSDGKSVKGDLTPPPKPLPGRLVTDDKAIGRPVSASVA